jgi:predicted RNA binding protein YcfA (HicA-like mRNA interferase family)
MPRLRKLSGHEFIKTLSNAGFKAKRQRGSHVVMVKETNKGKVGCSVPLHRELKIGTLKGLLKQAKLTEDEFMRLL